MSTHETLDARLGEELLDRFAGRQLPEVFFEATSLEMGDLDASVRRIVGSDPGHGGDLLSEDFQVERIIRAFKRPSLLVREGSFEPAASETWAETLEKNREAIERALPAVGRIELKNHSSLEWVGTGFLVAADILATNRHVAREFVRRDGGGFAWRRNHRGKIIRPRVDFREEHGLPEEEEISIVEVLHLEAEDGPDLALLRAAAPGAARQPLALRTDLDSVNLVGAVGYPWRDSRVESQLVEAMERIFQGIFDVKRFAPGTRIPGDDDEVRHDCTTLGGNSGSAIIDLSSGAAIGLHYGGYSGYNVAVPAAVVQDRLNALE